MQRSSTMGLIEHGLEAAEAVVTAMQRENEGYVGPYDEWLPQTIQAYLDATNLAGAVEERDAMRERCDKQDAWIMDAEAEIERLREQVARLVNFGR